MITKAKKLTFTSSDGRTCDSVEEAKRYDLELLCEVGKDDLASKAFSVLVAKPREAIAILKFGLPRKPRTPKPPMGKKPRRNLKHEMPEIPGV